MHLRDKVPHSYCKPFKFLRVRHHVGAVFPVIMSPSICLSEVHVLLRWLNVGYQKTMPLDSSGTPVLRCKRSLWNSDGITSIGGAKYMLGR